ncbi:MAG: Coenzyme F420 hydrogenase/dehydrogenase, beta subunit C-terminal domain [Ruminococcus sp.]|nr:Coenzyme F420 hydrogenase/dehydrogenase, beta subunit C-terminal domain [Ruminococcus sp.]
MNKPDNKDHYLCAAEKCLGCMACYNACAIGAIGIHEDELLTLLPKIDPEKCISCKRCSKVCPVLNPVYGHKPVEGYAAHICDEHDIKTCSSGGIAAAFYRRIIESGGSVVGAFTHGEQAPSYGVTDNKNDIEKLKGSKYVYVDPGKVFCRIKKDLDSDKLCLFVGTPCHVDALNHFLGKDYKNLITVDLICHGTPPFSYLSDHIRSVNKHRRKIKSYSFRGERDFSFVLNSDDSVVYQKSAGEDCYYLAFLDGLIHRKNCYSCPYANPCRVSDITIGDYWGRPDGILNGYKGKVSAVLINNSKGKDFWNKITDQIEFEITSVDDIIAGNGQLRQPSVPHHERRQFEEAILSGCSFDDAVGKTSISAKVNRNRIRSKVLWIPRTIKHTLIRK